MSAEAYETLIVSRVGKNSQIGLILLNRPQVLNAISSKLLAELVGALQLMEKDDSIRATIITGSQRAFSVGADIKAMQANATANASNPRKAWRFLDDWAPINDIQKPMIAAVDGYAYGGGMELAMMCDIVYASDSAKFAQPEVKIGIIPGAGGTQRLPRYAGKSLAMEMILTGEPISADEAERAGIVSKVVPAVQLLTEAIDLAERISAQDALTVAVAKEAVKRAFETSLHEGLLFERRQFHAAFTSTAQRNRMAQFLSREKTKSRL